MLSRPLKVALVIFLVLLIIGLFIFLAWFFSSIFTYFIISVVLSTILRPLVNNINRKLIYNIRIPRFISIFISFVALLSVLSLLVFLFIPLVSEQINVFTDLISSESFSEKITQPVTLLEDFLIRNKLSNEQEGFLMDRFKTMLSSLFSDVEYTDIFTNVLSITGSVFVGMIAVTFITFFLLYEKGLIKEKIIKLIPNRYFEVSIAALYKIEKLLSNYLIGLIFQMLSIFTIAFTGLSILGIKYSATIALFAAVINLIPYLGPILGAVFGVFVVLSTNTQLGSTNEYLFLAVKVLTVFGIVQLTDNILLQPLIFSKSVKAHPLEIFIIIFAGATLAGIPGMIAAIPVYTILRVTVIEIQKGYKSYYIFKI